MIWMMVVMLVADTVWAQQPAPVEAVDRAALVRQIERQFDVLLLREGVALRPKTDVRGARSIEISGGAIAIDGAPVSGSELRDRLGADAAGAVLQLSYLMPAEQRALFGAAPPAPPQTPAAGNPAPDVPVPVEPPNPDEPTRSRRTNDSGSDRVRIGGSVNVDASEIVDGDVVAIGGSATVDGEVQGDVVAIGGNIDLGPRAVVTRDVVVVGGKLTRADGAKVGGSVKEIGWGMGGANRVMPPNWFGNWWQRGFGNAFALVATLTRLAVLCLFAALVILLGGSYVEQVGQRAVAEPVKAGVIGFLAQLLSFPLLVITIIVLVVTIVGIPLLFAVPFLILALGVVALIGFTAVAYQIGRRVVTGMAWPEPGPYATTLAGILVLLSPTLIARLIGVAGIPFPVTSLLAFSGFVVEYLAWTIGFGAVALLKLHRSTAGVMAP